MNWKELMIIAVLILNKCFTLAFVDREKPGIDTNDITPAARRNDSDAIQKWSELGIELTRVGVSMDGGTLIEVIKSLTKAVPYLGSILAALADILRKPPDEVAEIKMQLSEMESRLFARENMLDALSLQITNATILSYYKSQSQPMFSLQAFYRRYIDLSNSVTLSDLKSRCEQNDVLWYIFYVENQLGDSSTYFPLMSTMLAGSDLANFQKWMKMLTAYLSQCMMLHTACMFSRNQNDTDGVQKEFQKVSNLLLKVTKNGTKRIRDNFFKDAKSLIESFAAENFFWSHENLATGLFSRLQKIFFFRNWFVFSYDEVGTKENHWITSGGSYVFSWFRMFNRNIQITHTNNIVSEELHGKYSKAASQHTGVVQCESIYNSIANQIRGSYNSIAVLQSTELPGNGFYAAYQHAFHTTVESKTIPIWRKKFYEVYIVPGEK